MIYVLIATIVLWALIGFFFANFGYATCDINNDTFLESRRGGYYRSEQDYIFLFILMVLLPVGIIFGVCGMAGKAGMKFFG